MKKSGLGMILLGALMLSTGAAYGSDISMKISGDGAINDSTIKAGVKVSFDIYWSNDMEPRGFTTGFKIVSETIKKVIHVADSGNGLNDLGDIKGHNGWEDKATWDLRGVFVVEKDWDGELPDTLGFAGLSVKNAYPKHPIKKVLSFEMIIPDTGILVIDSSFFPPGGYWKFGPEGEPTWAGPYKYRVVKEKKEEIEKKEKKE